MILHHRAEVEVQDGGEGNQALALGVRLPLLAVVEEAEVEVQGTHDELVELAIEAGELGGQVDVQPGAAVDVVVQGAGNADYGEQGGCHVV